MIIYLRDKKSTPEVDAYISGGVLRKGGVYSYWLKDISSNKVFMKDQLRGVTDGNYRLEHFEELWGRHAIVECLFDAWLSVIPIALQQAPVGSHINLHLVWTQGHFPKKAFEYIVTCSLYEAQPLRQPKKDREAVQDLYKDYGSVSLHVTKLRGKPFQGLNV